MSIFETLMLLCFGSAWPFSIYRSYKSKSIEGKSPVFLVILLMGYTFGILHKLFYSYDSVVYLYVINFIMITIDFTLYLRNSRLKKHEEDSTVHW
ncbi:MULTISPECIES: hypothetical protein [unclassified Sedimentibacter]|uniref:hypothetical protein n=1 Tax=unclassified Sedimentibacter TaxID=2649220 RepID=UPI0027E001E4|nr:hypothetical protein [Sedimentibacter sp. MB35-C1]WMJ77645.1 hypothetical protein RBQ61_01590 [Sedimentibacter sp. MB35-C1]